MNKPGIKRIFLRILNMVAFYLGWFVCMHEAVGPRPYVGPLLVGALLMYHFLTTPVFRLDIIMVSALTLIGTIVDSGYLWIGMLRFEGGYECCPYMAPLWISSLWGMYGASVNHSLEWLKFNYLLVAAPMGALGSISSYLVGVEQGAVTLLYSDWASFAIIGTVWAVVVPLSLKASERLARYFTP